MAKRFLGGGEISSDSLIPVGSIVSYFPGYFNSLLEPISSVSTIAEINASLPSSWRVCDGSVVTDSSSPVFRGGDTRLPDLTNNRFLRGSSTHGGFGGNSEISLSLDNIPPHTHTIPSHRHSMAHNHTASSSKAGTHSHTITLSDDGFPNGSGDRTNDYYWMSSSRGPASTKSTSAAGAHTHTITVATSTTVVTGYSGDLTTRSTGSAALFNIEPQYMDVIYIMKIK